MAAPRNRKLSLNTRGRGRVREEVPPLPPPGSPAAFTFPAGQATLQARHRDRWLVSGEVGHYEARRVTYGADEEPVLWSLTVSHATAQGLDAALTALGDLR